MKNKLFILFIVCSLFTVAIYFTGCKKQEYAASTTEDVNIVGYLDKYPDSFSLFRKILDVTGNTAFLNAYGAYTCFAPTNSGVQRWLSDNNWATVEAGDIEVMRNMVRFHLLTDTITTGAFTDGKLQVPTMFGQYLITGVSFSGGAASYVVNRQASIVKSNVKVGNGILHEIGDVLQPAGLTIAKQLEADPNYSIFTEVMRETGFFEKLNTIDPDTAKRWITVIAETNQVLADSGFTSYEQLKDKYSQTGNPTLATDSLNMYMAYHIINGINFLGDIITQSSQLTLLPQEVISVKFINQQVVINEDEFAGVIEKGMTLSRDISDNSATNGVWHSSNGHFNVKFRKPAAVYWDLCTQPEIMALPAYYMRQNYTINKQNQDDRPLKEMDWEWKAASGNIIYQYGTSGSLTDFACNNDVMLIRFGGPNRSTWMEFTTPVVIKGRYKVWFCYRNRNSVTCNVRINGTLMQRPVNLGEGKPAGTDAELESVGWKRYTLGGNFSSRLVGTIDIATTQRHTFRLESVSGSNAESHIDMVHFIPVDDDQILPRFAPDGSKVFE